MPIYEFICADNHKIEKYMTLQELNTIDYRDLICPFVIGTRNANFNILCALPLEKIHSTFNTTQVGKPSIVFRNRKTGEIQVASSEHEQAPYGFVKEELKTPFERSRFEKEYNKKMSEQDDVQTEMRRQKMADNQKLRQDRNRKNLSKIAGKADNPSAAKSLMRKAMERNRKRERVPKKKSNFRFEVN
jgi:hypothetical protein